MVVSTLSLAASAALAPSRGVALPAVIGALLALLTISWTRILIGPVNDEIAKLAETRTLEDLKAGPGQAALEENAMRKINEWRKLHRVRIALGAGMWLGALVAFKRDV